jgi:4-aminobutyrate aminotransferase-like enzyme
VDQAFLLQTLQPVGQHVGCDAFLTRQQVAVAVARLEQQIAIVCAAGVASIDIILEEKLIERAAAIDSRMRAHLENMAKDTEAIGEIRGRGVLYGVELVEDRAAKAPANALAREVVAQCQNEGLLVQSRGSHGRMNVIRLVPPMVSTDEEIDRGMEILRRVLAAATSKTARAA